MTFANPFKSQSLTYLLAYWLNFNPCSIRTYLTLTCISSEHNVDEQIIDSNCDHSKVAAKAQTHCHELPSGILKLLEQRPNFNEVTPSSSTYNVCYLYLGLVSTSGQLGVVSHFVYSVVIRHSSLLPKAAKSKLTFQARKIAKFC